MTVAQSIIGRLGGTRAAAKLLEKPPSTVQSWKRAGFIPARHQGLVLDAAGKAGIEIRAVDLIERPAQEAVG